MLVFLTGAGGFLGRHLAEKLNAAGLRVCGFGHNELDITDPRAVAAALDSARPDIVVNCAAISSTGYAAEHPDESMSLNVLACENLAGLCADRGIGLYVCSSDQVYGGCQLKGPLPENLDLSPNNVYGAHKLLMEGKVLARHPGAVVLRLGWMFERYCADSPHSDIVSRLVEARRDGLVLKASTREYRGMSDVDEVCDNIVRSFGVLPGGVYNFGSGNLQDSYSSCLQLAATAGLPLTSIVPDDSWGRNISMDCSRLESFGIHFTDTITAVTRCLEN